MKPIQQNVEQYEEYQGDWYPEAEMADDLYLEDSFDDRMLRCIW